MRSFARSWEPLEQLRGVAHGEAVISRRLAAQILAEIRGQAEPFGTEEALTARELEVLELVAARLSNAEIVGRLVVSEHTVKNQMRPTFLVTPRRCPVEAAKVWASMLAGGVFGVIAAAVASGVGITALATRGVALRLDGGDYALLLAGCTAAAALWAAIGVGVGAVVRNQVPAMVSICAWLLFVENLLLGDVGLVGDVGRFMPGALGKAMTGQDPQLAPGLAVFLLALYAAVAGAAGWVATTRRDIV
jgi:ABC-2 type transport system permease protein